MQSANDVAIAVMTVFAVGSVALGFLLYRLTRVKAFLVLTGAYVWSAAVLMGLSFVPFLNDHARELRIVSLLTQFIGLLVLYLSLRRVNISPEIQDIAKAATAAQMARERAIQAADAAETARLYSEHAMALADAATAVSRRAGRAAGAANEASRKADEEVGGDA